MAAKRRNPSDKEILRMLSAGASIRRVMNSIGGSFDRIKAVRDQNSHLRSLHLAFVCHPAPPGAARFPEPTEAA